MSETHAVTPYKTYWIAWLVLLVVTLLMVFVGSKAILLAGMVFKASLILFLFMHLKYEKLGLILSVVVGIFFFGLLLFGLMIPDGMAM